MGRWDKSLTPTSTGVLSGDADLLREMWPRVKKAIEFAWVPGGWDADRDGVMEGVQHNTYDVEFYGPNPQCGIYYLGALRAAEEMGRAAGDTASADEYRRVFESGGGTVSMPTSSTVSIMCRRIITAIACRIAPALRSTMGSEDAERSAISSRRGLPCGSIG